MGKFDHDETCSISFCATVDHSTSGTTTIITSTPAGSTEVDQIDTAHQMVGPKSSIGEYYGECNRDDGKKAQTFVYVLSI